MLYIINKKSDVIADCAQRASGNDVILLIENAVYAAVAVKNPSALSELVDDVTVFALTPDLRARGIDEKRCHGHIQFVDYKGFVELVEHNNPIRSCF